MRSHSSPLQPPACFVVGLFALLSLASCTGVPSIDWKMSAVLNKGIGSLTEEAWRADLDYLVQHLEKDHPDPWHAVSREAFIKALYAPIDSRLPSDLRARARWSAVMRALALMKECHTRLIEEAVPGSLLPIRVSRFSDGYYITAVGPDAADLVEGRLMAVNGIGVDDVFQRLRPYVSAESEGWAREEAAKYASDFDLLQDAGIAADGARGARIEVELDGAILARDVRVVDPEKGKLDIVHIFELKKIDAAETLRRSGELYWYRFLPERKAIVAQYNACAERRDLPFSRFCEELFAVVDRERPKRLVLDLRNNAGGNSFLFTSGFLPRIKESYLNRPGAIVVIIGPRVCSSGIFAVAEMKRDTKAILLGEPTAQGYTHYGMSGRFMLPGSGLVVMQSTRLWKLAPGGPGNEISPDIPASMDSISYFSGKDVVLEKALSLP